jgi:hypothetical protein
VSFAQPVIYGGECPTRWTKHPSGITSLKTLETEMPLTVGVQRLRGERQQTFISYSIFFGAVSSTMRSRSAIF